MLNVKGFLYSGEVGYMQDAYNKNMNRVFPGNSNSPSATERAVNTFWNEVILKADFTVNLHGADMAQVPRVVFSEHNPFMSETTLVMGKAIAYDQVEYREPIRAH